MMNIMPYMLESSGEMKDYSKFFTDDLDLSHMGSDVKKLVKFAQPCSGSKLPQYSRHRSKIRQLNLNNLIDADMNLDIESFIIE